MRLLVLDQFSDLGGAQQCLLDLLPAMRQRGWQVLVGLPGDGAMFERVKAEGFEARRIPCGPYRSGRKSAFDAGRWVAQLPRLALEIRRMAAEIAADRVLLNGPRLVPAAAAARLRCPVVFHAHSSVPPGVTQRLVGTALRAMDARLIGACRFVADPWRRYVPPQCIAVIYNGVPGPDRLGGQATRLPAAGAIGCIGRIAPEKGQREFLAAAAAIAHAIRGCRFLIYGAALFSDKRAQQYEREVRAAAAGLPVEFMGWAPEPYAALATLDLLLVPSAAQEATPRVIMEAFAAGVPVIARASGGVPEIVQHGRTGLLAGPPAEMAQFAIELLNGDPDRRAAIVRAARESWRANYTVERYRLEATNALENGALAFLPVHNLQQ